MGIFIMRKNILRCPMCGGTYFTTNPAQQMKAKCPSCGSNNVSKVGAVSRMVSVGLLGLASSKIGKLTNVIIAEQCGNNKLYILTEEALSTYDSRPNYKYN